LEKMLSLYQEIYINLLTSIESVRLARLQNTPNVVQIEAAALPTNPIRPKPLQNTLLAAALGLMLAGAIVFLAEATEDLQTRREALKTHLLESGAQVLPPRFYAFPEETQWRGAVDNDLARAALYVQLLSAVTPRDIPGFTLSRPDNQLARARNRAGLTLLQWRDPQTAPQQASDPSLREMLEHAIAMPFEELKHLVGERLRQALAEARRPPRPARNGKSARLVFVNTVKTTLEIAQSLSRSLKNAGHHSALPLFEAACAAADRQEIEDNLRDCDAVFLIWNNDLRWLREQLRACVRIQARRDTPLLAVAVNCPPLDLGMELNLPLLWLAEGISGLVEVLDEA